MKIYITYVLQSEVNGTFYIGHTSNLEERIKRHNLGREKYTKKYKPYTLIFKKDFDTKAEAYRFERRLKGFKNRSYLQKYILKKAERDRSSTG